MPSTRSTRRISASPNTHQPTPSLPSRRSNSNNGITKPRNRIRSGSTNPLYTPLRLALTVPFSQLSTYAHIPLADVSAYVTRSIATRHAEVFPTSQDGSMGRKRRKAAGHIPRPPNAFMLYRKCYRAQAQAFCKQVTGNEQGVSFACGESWRRETEAVKWGFRAWAEMEVKAHREAWPGWRYTPTPAGGQQKGKGVETVEEEEDENEEEEEEEMESGEEGSSSVGEQEPEPLQMSPPMPMADLASSYPEAAVQGVGFDSQWGLPALMAQLQQAVAEHPALFAALSALTLQGAFTQTAAPQQPVVCSRCACELPMGAAPQPVADIFQDYSADLILPAVFTEGSMPGGDLFSGEFIDPSFLIADQF